MWRASLEVEEELSKGTTETQARVNQYLLNEIAKLKSEVRRLGTELGSVKGASLAAEDLPIRTVSSYVYNVNADDGSIVTFSSSLSDFLDVGVECVVGARIDALLSPDFVQRTHAFLRDRKNGLLEQLYRNGVATLDEVTFTTGSSVAMVKVRPCRSGGSVRLRELLKTQDLVELVQHMESMSSRLAGRRDNFPVWSSAEWYDKTQLLLGEVKPWSELSEAAHEPFDLLAAAECGASQDEAQLSRLACVTDRLLLAVKNAQRQWQTQSGSLEMLRGSLHKAIDLIADRELSVEPRQKKNRS